MKGRRGEWPKEKETVGIGEGKLPKVKGPALEGQKEKAGMTERGGARGLWLLKEGKSG